MSKETGGRGEKIWTLGRNINLLGAAAFGAVTLLPGPQPIFAALAGLNLVQAGGCEIARQWSKNRHSKKLGKAALAA